mmetsp:Transcript_27241/g.44232  ORF Transcript_27241/g.44232 Transcript_27241/m.44232 type:complete len:209 (+) Transcript_27241:93-719(+)
MNSNSIHSPANSLVLSSSFHSIGSLSPPSTPGCKRSYYPDQLSPMPEFFSSNGSLLSADTLLGNLEVVSEEEDEAQEARQMEQMTRHPLPSFVLHPKSSQRMDLKLHLDQIPPMPYSEPSLPPTPTHYRMALSSLPRLPSLSEHNDVKPPSPTCMLKSEHIQHEMVVVVDNDGNKNTKLPAFKSKRKTVVRKRRSDEGNRNSLVARCA